MVLFIVRDIVESCVVILLTIVLGIVASSITKTIPSYTFIVLSSIVILIIPKILYNIIAIVK